MIAGETCPSQRQGERGIWQDAEKFYRAAAILHRYKLVFLTAGRRREAAATPI
jgi:hypothetical protein